ncbi:MAG: aminotransferase class I/II-fold pyridoxal phosphate-dependent enzyme [Sulfolobales archaeon]
MPSYNKSSDLLIESPTRVINRIAENMRKEGRDLIMFSAGEPGIPPPREIREWLSQALKEDSTKLYSYGPSAGFLDLREAIADDLRELGGLEIDSDQIVITSGGQGAIFSSLTAVLEEGDEVILIDPTFFGYKNVITFNRARIRYAPTSIDRGFQPDVDLINESIVRGRTKAIILVSPDNPTGRVIDWNIARALVEIAVDNDIWIIYDEPYKTLVYEGEHIYLYKLAPENVISLNAFSKDPGIPGWRLGYVYGPKSIIKRISLISEISTYHPSTVAQYLVLRYLRDRDLRRRHIEFMRRVLMERRDVMVEELSKIREARFLRPGGSMFVLLDLKERLRERNLESIQLAEKLLLEASVAVVPGEFFGESSRGSIRLSFATESLDRIREGVRRIREMLDRI